MGTWLIAIAIGLTIFSSAVWFVRLLGQPPPPEPDPTDVIEVAVDFECSVCGLRLSVTHAQDDEPSAPRHCREQMVPV